MKRKKFILSGLIFLMGLTACQGANIISSSSVSLSTSSSQSTAVQTTSSSSNITSSNNSSEQSSPSSNSAAEKISVKDIKSKAANYLSSANEVGV